MKTPVSFFSTSLPLSPPVFLYPLHPSIHLPFAVNTNVCVYLQSADTALIYQPHLFTMTFKERERERDDLMRRTGWQLWDRGRRWRGWEEMVWFQSCVCVWERDWVCYKAYFHSLTFCCQTRTVPFCLTLPSSDNNLVIFNFCDWFTEKNLMTDRCFYILHYQASWNCCNMAECFLVETKHTIFMLTEKCNVNDC